MTHLLAIQRFLSVVALFFASHYLLHQGYAQEPLQAEAKTLTDGGFLTPPEGLQVPVEFSIAKSVPKVDFVRLPLPDTPANPWSIWGCGLLHSNGRVYVAAGDHLGVNANSYVYEYDPTSMRIQMVADLQSAVDGFQSGDFGFGKVHGRLNEGADGKIYFPTYWGQWRKENDRYHGDRIFCFDPKSRQLSDLGMPAFGWGYPSSHMAKDLGLLYAEATYRKGNSQGDPGKDFLADGYSDIKDKYKIQFLAYDIRSKKVVFHGGHQGLAYGRDFFVDGDGNAYCNSGGGTLEKYDPKTNSLRMIEAKMPGEKIRRTTGPDENGLLYGVTNDTRKIFRFDPVKESIETVTTVWADSPGMDVDAGGKFLYFIPGGHGPSSGVPIVQVDLKTGSQKVIAFLHQVIWDKTQFNLGGTYSLQVSDDGSTIYIGFNGKDRDLKKAWGHLAFVTVHVPDSEL